MKRANSLFVLIILNILCISICYAQNSPANTGIKIVQKLEKPKNWEYNENDLSGYLLVYFKDQDQSAYMAISSDGYSFTDINNGNPVFIGSQLAEQKGVRDPHITRGPMEHFIWP